MVLIGRQCIQSPEDKESEKRSQNESTNYLVTPKGSVPNSYEIDNFDNSKEIAEQDIIGYVEDSETNEVEPKAQTPKNLANVNAMPLDTKEQKMEEKET